MKLLQALGISARVDTVQIPATCGAAKPGAAPFEAALAELGLEAGVAVYVGDDSEEDLEAIRALGLAVVPVGTLQNLESLVGTLSEMAAGPDTARA